MSKATQPFYGRFRVPALGAFRLDSIDPDSLLGAPEPDVARERIRSNRDRLASLQEVLYAEGAQSLLLVLQAMDTGGKDSTIRQVMRGVNPQGCQVTSFKAPTAVERSHDFLWRVHARVPATGMIGIFNRSHYEDVLIARVKGLAQAAVIDRRYEEINRFESLLSASGTRIVKVMLHISPEYQKKRLLRRLERPDKHWKFNPADLEERARWDDYMEAYEIALNRCSTAKAPWYVIPAEHRWFRNLVLTDLLVDTLEDMNPTYPEPTFDPDDYPPESII
jgi:PPK2 family polyphosphate:nucleotide phosphotransferase